jgi:hypothetical protein
METLKCKDLKIGTRVLLTKPDRGYTINESNPLVGTKWECAGSVDDGRPGAVDVLWDNGHHNSYKDHELSSACGGRCKSIW